MSEKMTYKQALEQLQQLVASIEDPKRDLTSLTEDVKKATDLAKYCKACLKKSEDDINKIING
ncbi:MAG: exodeoxyribonuclease VII small subunit [Bacteroidales bacterium]|jgi:exodeoxyribonuclease VII small subunit|nr:exodeoxyribonuclease VII small subunit [Bacteroidales bacterium]